MTVESSPSRAEVFHDGNRIGSTPTTVSLPRGTQVLTLSRPGFVDTEIEVDVPRRRFATLLVPPKTNEQAVLEPLDGLSEDHSERREFAARETLNNGYPDENFTIDALFAQAGAELTESGEIGESTSSRPLPPTLSEVAEDVTAITAHTAEEDAGVAERQTAYFEDFLLGSIQNVTSHAMARDLTHAAWRSASASGTPSALSASQIVHYFIDSHSDSEGYPAWLETVTSAQRSSRIRQAASYEDFIERNSNLDSEHGPMLDDAIADLERDGERSGTPIDASDIDASESALPDFVRVPAGGVLLGYAEDGSDEDSEVTRSLRRVESFYISRTPVSRAQWDTFVEDNPEWHPDNRSTLVDEGLAQTGYLAGYSEESSPDLPVTGVSFYAARAFARWVDEISGDAWKVSLPSETQWAHAAALDRHGRSDEDLIFGFSTGARSLTDGSERAGNLGLVDMLGNVWEWTDTPYYSADTVLRVDSDYADLGFPNSAVVRGGSWANAADEIGWDSRGGQTLDWTTPFLGFRLVAEETGD
ncbi:MAG: SUMF1/EgtB/PvdO family nonheme iron enzyme [Spirochaetales bacterium]